MAGFTFGLLSIPRFFQFPPKDVALTALKHRVAIPAGGHRPRCTQRARFGDTPGHAGGVHILSPMSPFLLPLMIGDAVTPPTGMMLLGWGVRSLGAILCAVRGLGSAHIVGPP
jgi:hypothetical protein